MKVSSILVILVCAVTFTGCSGNKNKKYDVDNDPVKYTPPSNSDATNPSLADTAYVNKDTVKKYDTSNKSKH
jgi:hypothetical protein